MSNEYVNKLILGSETLFDISGDTVTAADVAQGKTFHLASGAPAVGTASGGGGADGVSVFYGTCGTSMTYKDKTVVCSGFGSSHLVDGTVLIVRFSDSNTANNPTLNVNSTGATDVYESIGTQAIANTWDDGTIVIFVYESQKWLVIGKEKANGGFVGHVSLTDSTSSSGLASQGRAASPYAVKKAYDLAESASSTAEAKQDAYVAASVELTANGWSSNSQTVNFADMTASSDVIVSPAPSSVAAWAAAGVYCSAQGAGTLTFTCSNTPSAALTANVMVYIIQTPLYEVILTYAADTTSDKQSAEAGETVTLTNTGSGAVGFYARRDNGGTTGPVLAQSYGWISSGGTWSFTMPAEDVVITTEAKPR